VSVEATVLLANAASGDENGQINLLGLGWRITGPPPLPGFVVVAMVQVPSEREEPIATRLQLHNQAGELVTQGDEDNPQPVEIQGLAPVGPSSQRPSELPGGANLILAFAPGLRLDPGYYEWVLSVNGETRDHWRQRFYVRAKPDEYPPRPQAASFDPT
jgi:hypothetical protein